MHPLICFYRYINPWLKWPTTHHMAELPWVKSFVHLTAVALTYGVSSYRINQVVNTILYLWNFGQSAREDAAEERINLKYSEHESTNRKTSEDFATQYPLFGLDAMNRIDQASGKLIMQKYFQLLTTMIWHVGFSSGPGKKAAKAGERQRRAEEARCQEEEAKRRAGEEQRAREEQEGSKSVDTWTRKRRGKGKRKNWSMRSVYGRGTLNARLCE